MEVINHPLTYIVKTPKDVTEKFVEIAIEKNKLDEESSMLGEVALVEYDSPISKTNRVFLETLYDENAACVEVVQSLTLYAGRFPKDSYADYRTFARSVSRSYDGKIILVKP